MAGRLTYWQRTRRLTFVMLVLWVGVTFGINWFANELNRIIVFGFPLGFYLAAQGELLIFLVMIWFYNRRMNKLDAEYGIDDE